jgi:hypothetical protein
MSFMDLRGNLGEILDADCSLRGRFGQGYFEGRHGAVFRFDAAVPRCRGRERCGDQLTFDRANVIHTYRRMLRNLIDPINRARWTPQLAAVTHHRPSIVARGASPPARWPGSSCQDFALCLNHASGDKASPLSQARFSNAVRDDCPARRISASTWQCRMSDHVHNLATDHFRSFRPIPLIRNVPDKPKAAGILSIPNRKRYTATRAPMISAGLWSFHPTRVGCFPA